MIGGGYKMDIELEINRIKAAVKELADDLYKHSHNTEPDYESISYIYDMLKGLYDDKIKPEHLKP